MQQLACHQVNLVMGRGLMGNGWGFVVSEPTVSSPSSTVKVLLEDSFDEARSLVVLDKT